MADVPTTATGVRIVIVNEWNKIRVPVAGNVEIAIGDPIEMTSGKATLMSTTDTDNSNFSGIATTGQDGSGGASDVNHITVAPQSICRVTFASALANTVYAGVGVEVSAISSHVWTFAQASTGAGGIGWLYENGDGSTTDLLVKFDSFQVAGSGDGSAGEGFWEAAAIA